MKARFAALGALGASAGLAVALVAGSAAMAAPHHSSGGGKKSPPPAATSSYSCASFSGLNLTQAAVSYSGVALKAGQVVTASVAPAPSGDTIFLNASTGLNWSFWSGPATGFAFKAPADGVYSLGWTLQTPAGATVTTPLTWSFQCS